MRGPARTTGCNAMPSTGRKVRLSILDARRGGGLSERQPVSRQPIQGFGVVFATKAEQRVQLHQFPFPSTTFLHLQWSATPGDV